MTDTTHIPTAITAGLDIAVTVGAINKWRHTRTGFAVWTNDGRVVNLNPDQASGFAWGIALSLATAP